MGRRAGRSLCGNERQRGRLRCSSCRVAGGKPIGVPRPALTSHLLIEGTMGGALFPGCVVHNSMMGAPHLFPHPSGMAMMAAPCAPNVGGVAAMSYPQAHLQGVAPPSMPGQHHHQLHQAYQYPHVSLRGVVASRASRFAAHTLAVD